MSVRADQEALLIAAKEVGGGNLRVDLEALLIAVPNASISHVRLDQLFLSLLVPLSSSPPPSGYGQIKYPLSMPSSMGESAANLKKFDAVGESISPFTGQSQQQQWQDQHWELDLEWPEMTWSDYAPLDAFIGALHGKFGSFLWGPPLATAPRGTALTSGTPLVGTPNAPMPGSLTSIVASGLLSSPFPFGTYYCVLVMQDSNGIFYESGEFGPIVIDSSHSGFTVHWASLPAGPIVPASYWLYFGPAPGGENMAKYIPMASMGLNTSLDYSVISAGFPPAPSRNQAGQNLLSTQGWTPSASGILLPGDFLQLTAVDTTGVSRQRLYQYVGQSALNSDSSGNAVLDIFPSLRETVPTSTPVVLANPQGTFRLANNRREAKANSTKTFMLQLKCREAI